MSEDAQNQLWIAGSAIAGAIAGVALTGRVEGILAGGISGLIAFFITEWRTAAPDRSKPS